MALNNITSSNAVAVLTVDQLFPAGIVLDNFGSDQAFSQDEETFASATMGVDGKLSAAYRPSPKNVTLTFSAASPACKSLDDVKAMMEKNQEVYECTLVFTALSLGKVYTYTGGVMISANGAPNAKAEFEQVSYKFVFERLDRSTL